MTHRVASQKLQERRLEALHDVIAERHLLDATRRHHQTRVLPNKINAARLSFITQVSNLTFFVKINQNDTGHVSKSKLNGHTNGRNIGTHTHLVEANGHISWRRLIHYAEQNTTSFIIAQMY